MTDPFDLARFVAAQDPMMEAVREELSRGQKLSHWMWFVFPQLRGLGHSDMARTYAIASKAEAVAYLDHPVLGQRLRTCTSLVTGIAERSIQQIFGSPDDMKFQSSMTLVATVDPQPGPFREALDKYFGGQPDPNTLDLLRQQL